jgi:manganese/zinc/iron transport system permease protein
MTLASITWTSADTWIVVVGALCAMSAGLLGNFLVLRKMSMMGDAISHAVLPGLAIAFLITGSRDSSAMLCGAIIAGILTALFTQWIHAAGKVDQGASMGVVFTVFFAIGLVLIVRAADSVDLDPGCVLYGAIEYAPLDTVMVSGWELPRAALNNGGVLLLNLLIVLLLYKEFKISTFDPELATTLGINANLMHYLLMTLVAITTVIAFESVGSILVIAMLIVPAAVAHLLTDRLGVMITLSLLIGALSAVLGHLAAITAPSWVGFPGEDTITSGMIAVVSGLLLLVAVLAAPRHGVVSQMIHRAALTMRIVREDLLGMVYRLDEADAVVDAGGVPAMLAQVVGTGRWTSRAALSSLRRSGALRVDDGVCVLTDAGRERARKLVRSHRLWEAYLERHLLVPRDHLHAPAERLEHVTTAAMRAALSQEADGPTHDPHGRPIPPGRNA